MYLHNGEWRDCNLSSQANHAQTLCQAWVKRHHMASAAVDTPGRMEEPGV